MTYAVIAVERAMKIQEVILRAMSGALTWLQAADILGMHPRSLRRVDERQLGRLGVDERGRERSPKAAGGGFHGGRFFRRRLAHHHRAGRVAFRKSL
jgi:hypothetical protein